MNTLTLLLLILLVGALAALVVWGVKRSRRLLQPVQSPARQLPTGPQLRVTFNSGQVQSLALRSDQPLTIGRGRENALVIDSKHVSRQHARIYCESGRWVLQDEDSDNGTFVNGRPVMRCSLVPTDTIEIGPARLQLIHTTVPLQTPEQAQPGPALQEGAGGTSQRFVGPFAVVRTLGKGGVSCVLLARDTRRQQQLVALKLLNEGSDYVAKKFQQEGMLRLDHRHIARIYELGNDGGQAYIVIEYIPGPNLRRLLAQRSLSIESALALSGQILQALDYAHSQQVIHRDLKPENIMISPQQGVKIIDFGIAKIAAPVTRTRDGLVLGTPAYMSYEQAMGIKVNQTSDLYSVAIMLYEMLTGKVPFSASNPSDVIRQHQRALPVPLRELNSAIPAELDVAILRCLAKQSEQRFQTALEFAQALGCPLNQPLPAELSTLASRLALAENATGGESEQPTQTPAPAAFTPPVPAPPTKRLRIQNGSRRGATLALAPIQTLGRADLNPEDGSISRQHFRIEQTEAGCMLSDISSHGTLVDGQRVQRASVNLQAGAQIQAGQTLLVYEE